MEVSGIIVSNALVYVCVYVRMCVRPVYKIYFSKGSNTEFWRVTMCDFNVCA